MVAATYDEALRRLLVHEGGYSNHPSDPGGPTNFGITIHDYRKYVKPDANAADVRAMPLAPPPVSLNFPDHTRSRLPLSSPLIFPLAPPLLS